MSMEQNLYEGRKGQKRLKAIEKQIRRINEEFEHNYANAPEMIYLEEEVRWEGTSKLIFSIAQRNVNFKWNGLRDYGFIRLCRRWLAENGIQIMTPETTSDMMGNILPEKMCAEMEEELTALELSQ